MSALEEGRDRFLASYRDFEAGLGDAGRVRKRQITLCMERLGHRDLDLTFPSPGVVLESLFFSYHNITCFIYSGLRAGPVVLGACRWRNKMAVLILIYLLFPAYLDPFFGKLSAD